MNEHDIDRTRQYLQTFVSQTLRNRKYLIQLTDLTDTDKTRLITQNTVSTDHE